MTKISIIIPVFNEEKNIKILINEILNIDIIDQISEIIIVDDCSTDSSLNEIKKLQKITDKISFFCHYSNQGQSKSLLTGIKNAKNQTIVTIDADLQNNPIDIINIVNTYFSDNEIKLVGGIRVNRKDNIIKKITSRMANFIRNQILRDDCIDTGCSLKIFDRDLFLSLPFFDGIHRFLPALFKYKNSKNKYIGVDHRNRKFGKSKYGTLDRALKGLVDIYKVKKIIKNFRND